MSIFEVEQEVWEVEGIRIAFIPPVRSQETFPSYALHYPEALPKNSLITALQERVATVVGPGMVFAVLSDTQQALLLHTEDIRLLH